VSVALLVIALSVDSLGVGVAYGLRGIRLPLTSYVIMALCTGTLMSLSMAAGGWLGRLITPGLGHLVGGLVLVGVGFWQLLQGWNSYRREIAGPREPRPLLRLGIPSLGLIVQILVEPGAADVNRSGEIDAAESVALGVALGLDALGAGLGAAMTGFPPVTVPLVTLACVMFVGLGLALGRLPSRSELVRKSFALPGVLIIGLGLLRLR